MRQYGIKIQIHIHKLCDRSHISDFENIERLTHEPQNIDLRNTLLKASNIAGFAISNTKTAAAHSISYPLTINFNIPHGIACSLPLLPPIIYK